MVKRVIISGGGTGGHIFPAISIAQALQRLQPGIELLFVGALGRMEMERVPAAGFQIVGLDIQGIDRASLLKNLALPLKLWKSVQSSKKILKDFRPDAVVGVGGYASGPLLYAAGRLNVPYLIQEQNSYAGLTNKKLAKRAASICVAFEGMEKYFPREKLIFTGNPIRKDAVRIDGKRAEAMKYFNLSAGKKVILLTGGSLGSATLNASALQALQSLAEKGIQLIWQCGKHYYKRLNEDIRVDTQEGVFLTAFLDRMDLAYAAADVIVSRAGAGTIAELCAVGKPSILVPSPNVADDHQTLNAQALTKKDAALMVEDAVAREVLFEVAIALLGDQKRSAELSENMRKMAVLDADEQIAGHVLDLIESRKKGRNDDVE